MIRLFFIQGTYTVYSDVLPILFLIQRTVWAISLF